MEDVRSFIETVYRDTLGTVERLESILEEIKLPEFYTYEIKNKIITCKGIILYRLERFLKKPFDQSSKVFHLKDLHEVTCLEGEISDEVYELVKNLKSIKEFQGNSSILMLPCPACGGKISSQAKDCPHCGQPLSSYLKENTLFECPKCGRKHKYSKNLCDCRFPLADIKPHHFKYNEFFSGEESCYLSDSYNYDEYGNICIYNGLYNDVPGGCICWFNVRAQEDCEIYVKCSELERGIQYYDVEAYRENTLDIEIWEEEYWAGASREVYYEIGHVDGNGKRKKLIEGIIEFEDDGYGSYEIVKEEIKTELFREGAGEGIEVLFGVWDEDFEDDEKEYTPTNCKNEQEFDPSEWDEESYLRQKGYSVSQKEGLSDDERQEILRDVIYSKVLTKSDIISHLERMINLRKNQVRYENAIEKWKMDIEFIRGIQCK